MSFASECTSLGPRQHKHGKKPHFLLRPPMRFEDEGRSYSDEASPAKIFVASPRSLASRRFKLWENDDMIAALLALAQVQRLWLMIQKTPANQQCCQWSLGPDRAVETRRTHTSSHVAGILTACFGWLPCCSCRVWVVLCKWMRAQYGPCHPRLVVSAQIPHAQG